jgi:bifunctional DNase/RNase
VNKIELKIVGILPGVSPAGGRVLLFTDEKNHYNVPVIIGIPEARAIAVEMEHARTRRPLTVDLMKNLMDRMGATLVEVYLYRWESGIFYADMRVALPDGDVHLDARVSDATALALRFSAPVYMLEEVLQKTALVTSGGKIVPGWTLEERAAPGEDTSILFFLPDEELTRMMEEAVAAEDYEKASRYRDELKTRKKQVTRGTDNI